jgi:hypothetical protein
MTLRVLPVSIAATCRLVSSVEVYNALKRKLLEAYLEV